MFKISDLTIKMNDNVIIEDFNLIINKGEVHILMGPNGSGKSTLAYFLAGHPHYQHVKGSVTLENRDLLKMTPDERSLAGLFLALQYPTDIPGVANGYFIKTALNAHLQAHKQEPLDSTQFLEKIKPYLAMLNIPESFLMRSVNEGFSGGEKKCNEILQCLMLQPQWVILDETDSGLDVDSLKRVAAVVNHLRNPGRCFLIITHYPQLLDLISPDHVHIMKERKIIQSGGIQLANKIASEGYTFLTGS